MAAAIRFNQSGSPDVLTLQAVPEQSPGPGEVWLEQEAIGRVSFQASLDSLRPRGLLVSFGASSRAPAAVELATLDAKGSLFLPRPSLAALTATIDEYQARAQDVLAAIDSAVIQP